MELINNIPISDYGLVLVRYNNILDMPKRTGEVFYNWGDELQPLTHEDDIAWDGREFTMELLHDSRLTDMTLQEVINTLKGLSEFELSSQYGDFNVVIKEIRSVRKYDSVNLFTIGFFERFPVFGTLDAAVGGTSPSISGYSLKGDFGIDLVKQHPYEGAQALYASPVTTYQQPQGFSQLRAYDRLRLDCVLRYDTAEELSETTGKLKALLSQSGTQELILDDLCFDVFFSEGFSVQIIGENIVRFDLNFWAKIIDPAQELIDAYTTYVDDNSLTWESQECTADYLNSF